MLTTAVAALLAITTTQAHPMLRLELQTPGGPLPVIVASGDDPAVITGDERIDLAWITPGDQRTLPFPAYGSEIVFEPGRQTGVFRTPRPTGSAEIPFKAVPASGPADRFDPTGDPPNPAFAGRWRTKFESSDDDAVGVFDVDETTGIATGTFLTTTGDYRYLAGRVDGDRMRLSAFDGAHAFLFHATLQADRSITGDFWSGTWWHESWTATRDDDIQLPDAFGLTKPAILRMNEAMLGRLFYTSTTDGSPAPLADVLPHGSPRILYLFGTWCPNCSDATTLLKQLAAEYPGLRIAGLAFEHHRDNASARVKAYAEHNGITWPVLLGGSSKKSEAAEAVPFLDGLRSYPTTVFIDREGDIRGVYQGFSGPATGKAHEDLQRRWRDTIKAMLRE